MHFREIIKLQFEKERHTLLCILKLFTDLIHELSLKNAWLPPIFFLDFNRTCWDLHFMHNHTPGKKYLKLVGTVHKTTIGVSLTLNYHAVPWGDKRNSHWNLTGVVRTVRWKRMRPSTERSERWHKMENIEVKESHRIESNSGTSYRITASQTKYIVPYKAIIQVQFSARLEGFLIWRGGPNGENPNYHEKWRSSDERPSLV